MGNTDGRRKNDRQKASRPRIFAAVSRRVGGSTRRSLSHHRMWKPSHARSSAHLPAGRLRTRSNRIINRRSSASPEIVSSRRHYRFIVASVTRPSCSPRPRPRGLIFAGRRTSIILPYRLHPRPRKEARSSTSSWVSAVVSVALSY